MKKKVIGLSIMLVMILLVLVGCGSSEMVLTDMSNDDISKKIFEPALHSGILNSTWTQPEKIEVNSIILFYTLENPSDSEKKSTNVEKSLSHRFGITTDELKQTSHYNANNKTYSISDVIAPSMKGEVASIDFSDNMVIHYNFLDGESTEYTGALTISGKTFEEYQFISNKVEITPKDDPIVEPPIDDPATSQGSSSNAPLGSAENPIAEEPIDPTPPLGSAENPIAEEPQDEGGDLPPVAPTNPSASIPNEGEVVTPDANAPLGSAENPIAEEPKDD